MTRPSIAIAVVVLLTVAARADPPATTALLGELRWRSIGPYRGGRTKAAAGVPTRPGTFYIGVCNGGVWKTTDYGRTWDPIFDDQPTGSIGALAIAPSNPDVIYVGSGEGLHRPDLSTGDGIYRSSDAGKTWRHLGLRDGQQIPQIVVDPTNPDRLFVAVLGHPYGPNPERGIYRSLDGGASFDRVLYRDPDTGGADVVLDPSNPQIVYAVLWEAREAPWENGEFDGPGSGLYKSTDGGATWRHLENGLPSYEHDGLGRIGVTVAPSNPRRLFATVDARRGGGLYRSDDAGETWGLITDDSRVAERASDFAEVKVHPDNPDIVFTASVVTWKSTDGGKSFVALRGAPGGDDYHRLWIDPVHPDTMLLAGDQGAIVTVNGGRTWSSWYNQPTAQMFHVTTDNAFPYRVCGGQQESGSACVSSRSGEGEITFRDWHPAGFEEYGYAAPDPLDPDIVYGGKLTRWDRRTGQAQEVAPRIGNDPDYRTVRTQPVVFSPIDPHLLYFASNTLWQTSDGGRRWTQLSSDLSRATWEAPASLGKYRADERARASQRGVIYAVAPSPLDRRTIWAGSDDGLVHLTRDGGKTWKDVTPAELTPWAKVSIIDAGRFDALTAYVAVNTLRLDDLRPHIYRTHDGGQSWTAITAGLPDGGSVNVVREDPRRRGLLYAGTEQAVYTSFDDGATWQSLRLGMPATSIRDLAVKDDDLVVATHGRGFWILDDVTPLRQLAEAAGVFLFEPRAAWRARWNTNSDTPLPPDEPAGQNPPDGAILDYYLGSPARIVVLEIFDSSGAPVRRYSSQDVSPPIGDDGNVPAWWIRPAPRLSVEPGVHRLVWDLHYPAPAALQTSYPISAIAGNTPREPRGPWALPGRYTVKLTADGRTVSRPLLVKLDPRVKTPAAQLRQQFELSRRIAAALEQESNALLALRRVRIAVAARALPDLDARLAALDGQAEGGDRAARPGEPRPAPALSSDNDQLARALDELQAADVAPTPTVAAAATRALAETRDLLERWRQLEREATARLAPP